MSEANPPPCPAAQRAIKRIKIEHRALARILAAMQVWVIQCREGTSALDLDLFEAMMSYVEQVPDGLHHPREDDTLFPAVASHAGGPEIIEVVEREHKQCGAMLDELRRAYGIFKRGGANALNQLSTAVDEFAEFYWAHMRKEEQRVLPFAVASLTDEQWERIDAAFARHDDPLFGPALTEKYRRLYEYIAALTPQPLKDHIAAARM